MKLKLQPLLNTQFFLLLLGVTGQGMAETEIKALAGRLSPDSNLAQEIGANAVIKQTVNGPQVMDKNQSALTLDEKSKELIDNVRSVAGVASVAYELKKTGVDSATVSSALLPELQKLRQDLDRKVGLHEVLFRPLKEEADRLDEESRRLLEAGDLTAAKVIAEGFARLQERLLEAYAKLPAKEMNARTVLARNYVLSKQGEKAWYGRDDNYRPEIYHQIHEQTRSCAGIFMLGGSAPEGSAVLVGRNLVLTACHVLDKVVDAAAEMDVVFDYVRVTDPVTRVVSIAQTMERCAIKRVVFPPDGVAVATDDTTSPLDYALLEIEPPQQARVPVVINRPRVGLETPIVLVGHPLQVPQLVHDNSWVKYPYLVSEAEFNMLLVGVNNEFIGSGAAAAEADRFLQFYQEETVGGKKLYRYVNRKNGLALPAMGAECDTFPGDSGAPAMLRENGKLVGILVRGEPNQEQVKAAEDSRLKSNAYTAGWRHHEILLPVEVILDQLNRKCPKQPDDPNVPEAQRKSWQEHFEVKIQ